MRRWQPHVDLGRLCAALEQEILAATDEEARRAYHEVGRSISTAASEVRTLIAGVNSDQDGADPGLPPAGAVRRREHCARQH